MHLLLMPRSRLIHASSPAPTQSMPQPSTPADCSLGKASMTSPHSRCLRAPMRTMNAATLRDDQMQFHSYWPKSCFEPTARPFLCSMGGGRWGGIEAPNLPSCVMPAMTPFSVSVVLTAHMPQVPLVAVFWGHGTTCARVRRAWCIVTPTDPGWAADGRRRERLPLPHAYDKYYDDDLGASTRHSCMPSAHTGFCANGLPPKLLWARAALVVYVTPHPRHVS
ncbi:hypothetical protein DFH08DRAFT_1055348 [Mycena albidolilacea]|uniref:Uncharacterized protein n=1 Tax=Mycena albidolilacea TaxID=1033008 RepID=A0AAD6Z3B6_9AGAR|nr:hypothetical protein DFH08DRAFT_1055348 [Mycena albidolilacea]